MQVNIFELIETNHDIIDKKEEEIIKSETKKVILSFFNQVVSFVKTLIKRKMKDFIKEKTTIVDINANYYKENPNSKGFFDEKMLKNLGILLDDIEYEFKNNDENKSIRKLFYSSVREKLKKLEIFNEHLIFLVIFYAELLDKRRARILEFILSNLINYKWLETQEKYYIQVFLELGEIEKYKRLKFILIEKSTENIQYRNMDDFFNEEYDKCRKNEKQNKKKQIKMRQTLRTSILNLIFLLFSRNLENMISKQDDIYQKNKRKQIANEMNNIIIFFSENIDRREEINIFLMKFLCWMSDYNYYPSVNSEFVKKFKFYTKKIIKIRIMLYDLLSHILNEKIK